MRLDNYGPGLTIHNIGTHKKTCSCYSPVTCGDTEQSSGEKDKTMKEIFEGDIVSYPEQPNHLAIKCSLELPAPVIFRSGVFCIDPPQRAKDSPGRSLLSNWTSINSINTMGFVSIIGNIHENEKLLT